MRTREESRGKSRALPPERTRAGVRDSDELAAWCRVVRGLRSCAAGGRCSIEHKEQKESSPAGN